jgi:prepilin peptidase CpaA
VDFTIQAVLAATVLTAAITDLFSQRVPNWLTMPITVLALCLHFADGGTAGALWSAAGWLTGFGLLIGLYALGGTGAGDVKLLAAVGALAGPSRVFSIFLYTALLGGVYALGIVVYSLVAKVGWAGTGQRLRAEGTSLLLSGGDLKPLASSLRSYPKLRYAIVVALGLGAEQLFGPLSIK